MAYRCQQAPSTCYARILALQVQAAIGKTAAAAAAVTAVLATEGRWEWRDPSNMGAPDGQGYTPSELGQHIALGQLAAGQDVFPVGGAGGPRAAGEVVQGWRDALAQAHQMAAGQFDALWCALWCPLLRPLVPFLASFGAPFGAFRWTCCLSPG